jgi:hypothetical protein
MKTILGFDKINDELLDLKDRSNDIGVFKCIAVKKTYRCRAVVINVETNVEGLEEVWSLLRMKTAELGTEQHVRKLVEHLLCRRHAITEFVDHYVEVWHEGKLPEPQTPLRPQPAKNASAPAKMTKTVLTNRAVSLGETSPQLEIISPTPSRSDRGRLRDGFQNSLAEESPILRKSKRRSEDKLRTPIVKHRRRNSAPPRPFEGVSKTLLPETPRQTSHSAFGANETTPPASPASSSWETLPTEDLLIVSSQQRPGISSDDSRADHSSLTSVVPDVNKSMSDKSRVGKMSPKSPLEIDECIRTLLRQDLKLTKGEEREKGVIYVLKNRDKLQLLKIGITTRSIWKRKREVEGLCCLPLETVYDREQRAVAQIKRLEQLVHTELSHFSTDPACRCSTKGVEHHEWFDLPKEEAVATVKIWRRFIQMSPYRSDGSLAAFWRDRVDALEEPPEDLNHHDHSLRHKRWVAFVSPSRLDILLYTARSFFSNPLARDRLLKHWYLPFVAILAVVIQYQTYGLLSALFWYCLLSVIFVDMLE